MMQNQKRSLGSEKTFQEIQPAVNWQVYIILCSDGSLYTGITTDIERRFHQHATGGGAKYFRGRQPTEVVYLEDGHSRSSAASRESAIKCLGRGDKLVLVSGQKQALRS